MQVQNDCNVDVDVIIHIVSGLDGFSQIHADVYSRMTAKDGADAIIPRVRICE